MQFTADDERYMRRALALAARGEGRVEPNPMVGAVIVRGDRVVGEGYHRQFGGPHAEVEALRGCGGKARGATCYVTLEPCCHHGKTPPCTGALIAAGISRVVAAMRDPFVSVSGGGFRALRSAGIRCDVGLFGREANELNAPFVKRVTAGRPWVILKWAQSLDGKIATHAGMSKWITSAESRREAHRLRGRVDAIIVGVGTVLADDPDLTCRDAPRLRVATRVVLDTNLRTPANAKLARTARRVPTLLLASARAPAAKRRKLVSLGCEVCEVPVSRDGRLSLPGVLDEFGRRGMTNVMVEGGGRVLGAFFDADLADEAWCFVAPKVIGGEGAAGPFMGRGVRQVPTKSLETLERHACGPDQLTRFRFHSIKMKA